MVDRWIKAQQEPGDPEYTWWAIVDTQEEGVRATALGVTLAQDLVDALNLAEQQAPPSAHPPPEEML